MSETKEYKLVIFDVDGTLVKTKSGKEFRDGAADWELLPRRSEVLAALHEAGVKTAIASNQGGVAFGYMRQDDIERELCLTADALGMERATIHYCTDHPNATINEHRGDSPWRKPGPLMLMSAMAHAGVPREQTLMVGDRPEDQKAAEAAGCDFTLADEYFAEPVDPEHQWISGEDRGKTWRRCRRCGMVGGIGEDVTTPCSGMMDEYLKLAQLEPQVADLTAELARLSTPSHQEGESA